MLGIALAAVGLSFALDILPDQRVALRGLPQYPLPPSCFSRTYFGVDCPGCGLTRSFILLAQGELWASVARHRLGWLLAVAVLLQIPYRIAKLCWPQAEVVPRHWPRAFSWLLLILLAANWVMGGFSIFDFGFSIWG